MRQQGVRDVGKRVRIAGLGIEIQQCAGDFRQALRCVESTDSFYRRSGRGRCGLSFSSDQKRQNTTRADRSARTPDINSYAPRGHE